MDRKAELSPIPSGCSDPSKSASEPTVSVDVGDQLLTAPPVGPTAPVSERDLFSLPPEEVTPGWLADVAAVEAAREAFKRRLRAGALARPLGAGTFCAHGKIKSLLPDALSIKRVSSVRLSSFNSISPPLIWPCSSLSLAGRRPARPP